MTRIPKPREIIDRRGLIERLDEVRGDGDLSAEAMRARVLDLMKETLGAGRAEIRRRLEAGASGAECVHAHAHLIDQMLRVLFPKNPGDARPGGIA